MFLKIRVLEKIHITFTFSDLKSLDKNLNHSKGEIKVMHNAWILKHFAILRDIGNVKITFSKVLSSILLKF